MIIGKLNLPYNDFKIGDVIDSEEFDANNEAIVSTVNEIIDLLNHVEERTEDIFFPNYIKETYIDGVELRSPKITGNTLVGSTGMVGITSVGGTNDSVRIWAGSNNIETAPFRVKQDGSVVMSKLNINLGDNGSAGITSDTPLANSVVMWAGSNDKDIAPFKVKKDGSVTMNNVTVGQNGIVGLTSDAPTDNSIVMWAGNSNKNIAPFRVTKNGNVTLRDVDITFDSGGNYGISPNEPGENPIVLWAGNENKLIAPFRVTKKGGVTMSNADVKGKIETNDIDGSYIKIENNIIKGGTLEHGEDFFIGSLKGINTSTIREGLMCLYRYSDKVSSAPIEWLQVTPRGVITSSDYLTLSASNRVVSESDFEVIGNLHLRGDIYVNGVRMQLTPA